MTDHQISSYFSATYFEARRKFLDACAARSLSVDSRLNPNAKGPSGEDLFTDVVRIGPANPQKALLLISLNWPFRPYFRILKSVYMYIVFVMLEVKACFWFCSNRKREAGNACGW